VDGRRLAAESPARRELPRIVHPSKVRSADVSVNALVADNVDWHDVASVLVGHFVPVAAIAARTLGFTRPSSKLLRTLLYEHPSAFAALTLPPLASTIAWSARNSVESPGPIRM
jgi:hypothetical protein